MDVSLHEWSVLQCPGHKVYDIQYTASFTNGTEGVQTLTLSLAELNGRSDEEKVFIIKLALKSILDYKTFNFQTFDRSIQNLRSVDVSSQPPVFKTTEIQKQIESRVQASRTDPLQTVAEESSVTSELPSSHFDYMTSGSGST